MPRGGAASALRHSSARSAGVAKLVPSHLEVIFGKLEQLEQLLA
jgi:hypothetical protein